MERSRNFILGFILLILLVGCGQTAPVCSPGSVTYFPDDEHFAIPLVETDSIAAPAEVEIGGKTIQVDQVIAGPLCNNRLAGTVYVGCDVQIKPWSGRSNFLDGCDFYVESGTVIYVAAHNNQAYYNGCAACHASSTQ